MDTKEIEALIRQTQVLANPNKANQAAIVLVADGSQQVVDQITHALLAHTLPAPHVLTETLLAIHLRGGKGLAALQCVLTHSPDPVARGAAALALGQAGTATAYQSLLQAVSTERNNETRADILFALGNFPQALEILQRAIADRSESPGARFYATRALVRLSEKGVPEAKRAVQTALRSAYEEVRRAASLPTSSSGGMYLTAQELAQRAEQLNT